MKNKINLLYITRDDSKYIVPASVYFIKELSKVIDLKVSHESGHIEDVIMNSKMNPDFIFINDYGENGSPNITGLKDLKIPFAVGLHDLHYNYPNRKQNLLEEEIKFIFTYYRDKFLAWYPEFSSNMKWLPHHVNTDIFYDYNLKKDTDLLMIGSMLEAFYPLRINILKRFEGRPGFTYHRHPGYKNITQKDKEVFVGMEYAMEINKSKIFLTCDSIHKYPLMKYYEVTACNSLLLAPLSDELLDLGFIPGVNFVSIDENDFEEKAYYYLQNEEERKIISCNGMKMSHKKHSTKKRVLEFIKIIEDILEDEKLQNKNPH
ncbi:UNVERIFIED_ORG: spore maturation protein CgeB [Peribacillus simplex]